MTSQKIGTIDRCALNGQAALICEAPADSGLYVTVWNMPEARSGVSGTVAYLSTNREMATPNFGMPLPANGYPFMIYLEPGETLWGAAYNEALLGMSTRPEV